MMPFSRKDWSFGQALPVLAVEEVGNDEPFDFLRDRVAHLGASCTEWPRPVSLPAQQLRPVGSPGPNELTPACQRAGVVPAGCSSRREQGLCPRSNALRTEPLNHSIYST